VGDREESAMRDRKLLLGVLPGVLFAVNVLARLINRFALEGEPAAVDRLSFGMFAVLAVILALVSFVMGRRYPLAQWSPYVGAGVLIALAATVLIGPFVSGGGPFADGVDAFFVQIAFYLGFTAAGAIFGYLVLITLGKDYRSESLRRLAEAKLSKPRRVVRR